MEWLEQNQDKPLDDILRPLVTPTNDDDDANAEPPALKPGEEARSLMCNECGKKFRSQAQAEFHASKTQHVDFAESTEEVAPLTEEEKKARLEELRKKLAEKRAGMSEQDKIDKKKNEVSALEVAPRYIPCYIYMLSLTRGPRKYDARALRKRKTSRKTFRKRSSLRKPQLSARRSKMSLRRRRGLRRRSQQTRRRGG